MIAELIDPAILGFILVGVMLFAIFVGLNNGNGRGAMDLAWYDSSEVN